MNKVTFKQISIRNFLSIGNEPVVVCFNTGLNIITGLNKDKEDRRNGVGKSSVADALNFAIFGAPIRDIKVETITNDTNSGKCEVVLDFTVETPSECIGYRIIRRLNPSAVEFYINGVDKTLDTISNTTAHICKILNCSQEIFDNCVIMTLNSTLPFMGKKKNEKRKFIEGIFNLEVFSDMLASVKTEYVEIKKNQDIQIGKISENTSTLNTVKTQQLSFADSKAKKIKALQSNVESLNTARNALILNNEKLSTINFEQLIKEHKDQIAQILTKKDSEDKTISGLIAQAATKAAEVSARESILRKIITGINECPVCLRIISDTDKLHIDTEKARVTTEIAALRSSETEIAATRKACLTTKSKYDTEVSEINRKIANIVTLQQQYVALKKQLDDNQTRTELLNKQIVDAEAECDTFSELVSTLSTKITELATQIEKTKQELVLLDKVKFVLSEEGVKSFLIKRILDVLNNRLGYYLGKLDANCSCMFDEYFEERIVNDKGKVCSYYNFSGAERKTIDLACLFTFMDIRRLQGDVSFNVSIYDELLDSSLDEKCIELVLGILHERIATHKEAVFVISHRKESIKFATGEIIMLEKQGGVTRRVASYIT